MSRTVVCCTIFAHSPFSLRYFHSLVLLSLRATGRDLAIIALKESVKLNNPSDWHLLVELTAQEADLKAKGDSANAVHVPQENDA